MNQIPNDVISQLTDQTIQQYASLRGRTAVVTGGASGIGAAVVRSLIRQGAKVYAADVVSSEVADYPTGAEPVVVDLTTRSERRRLIEITGVPDLLVNAAGISRPKNIFEVDEHDWDQTFDINAKAVFFLMQQYAMEMQPGSAVVNVASIAGKTAHTVHGAVYNASKAAVIAMTKTFAYALADRQIRVNSVCPGLTDTPMLEGIYATTSGNDPSVADQQLARYLATIPLGRRAHPDEIAALIVFLLSGSASYMTGQAVNVSGGLVMW